jgi:hypothetical protein
MLLVMITRCRRHFLPVLTVVAALLAISAQARTNPYETIVERNAFGLKPPPPPATETNQVAAEPPVKVVLTGITSVFGPPRALLEIVEQAPPKGGTAVPPRRPILREGDREGAIEVLAISIERNIVKIRNDGVESELTFEVPKQSGPSPTGHVAGVPPSAAPAPLAASQPIIVSSSNPRGGVTMAGGGTAFEGNTAGVTSYGGTTAMASGNSGSVSSYGGFAPPPFGGGGTPALASAGGVPAIPSRTIRTPTAPASQVDPETQMILIEANRLRNEQINNAPANRGGRPPLKMPPLPPTPLQQQIYGGNGAGAQ